MFKSILLGSFCLIALSACGGEIDSSVPQNEKITTKEQVFQKLEDEGKLPKLERTDSILGIDKDYGSLEVGKSATLFISEGDALDQLTNQVTHAFIDGRQIELNNQQKNLYERYKEKYSK